jgi:uncharacterized membrane protein (UPF0127 family)
MSFLKRWMVFIFLIVIGILSVTFLLSRSKSVVPNQKPKETVSIKGTLIFVEKVVSPEEKQKGLSGRNFLPEDQGMLFVFEEKSYPTFWMKDMLIPLDIIWITEAKISKIDKNVPPPNATVLDSNLSLYKPNTPIDYVLEVNAGFSDKNGFQVGDTIIFNLK